jgi:UDPglucose--hexose-1-phosphate uridylyltransferase
LIISDLKRSEIAVRHSISGTDGSSKSAVAGLDVAPADSASQELPAEVHTPASGIAELPLSRRQRSEEQAMKPELASTSERSALAGDSELVDYDRPHSRMDVITGRWTLFANHRGERPNDFVFTATPKMTQEGCPFCKGNEASTPEPVLILPRDDSGVTGEGTDWGIRVVPNKYPAVGARSCESSGPIGTSTASPAAKHSRDPIWQSYPNQAGYSRSAERQPTPPPDTALFPVRGITGGHEVFIESPEHFTSFADLDLGQVANLLRVYQARLGHWAEQPSIRYVSLFKNAGPSAGASLLHPHSQLIAVTEMPQAIRVTIDRMRRYHARTGCCLQCDVVRAELRSRRRLIAVTDRLVAYCPFASYLPMLVRITTRQHAERFEDLGDDDIDDLARLIRRSIGWLNSLYPDVAYNFLIHTRPPQAAAQQGFHWSFELFPRLTQIAGFEWSCDTVINPLLPEDAATRLRAVAVRENPLRD